MILILIGVKQKNTNIIIEEKVIRLLTHNKETLHVGLIGLYRGSRDSIKSII